MRRLRNTFHIFQNKKIKFLLTLTVLSVVFSSCSKKLNPSKPEQDYISKKLPVRESRLRLPVQVSIAYLESQLTGSLEDTLYTSADDLKSDWGKLDVEITRNGNIKLKGSENALGYRVPIHVKLDIESFLFSKKLNFDANLDFSTAVSFQDNWKVATKTEFLKTQVLGDVRLSLGFISIPVQTVMNWVMEATEDDLETEIDAALQENLDLSKWVNQINEEMQKPYLINEEYKTWLQFKPKYFELSAINGNERYMYFTLGATTVIDMTLGQKPLVRKSSDLPALKTNQPLEDEFDLQLPFEIQYQYLKDAINKEFSNTEYSAGNKKFTLDSIDLYANGKKLIVESFISGDVEGKVYLAGIPAYNAEKQEIYMKDLDFDVQTKKAVLKLASWIFKSTFRDKMEEEMRYSLKEDLETVESNMNDFLKEALAGDEAKNSSISFDLENMNIDEIFMDSYKLSGYIESQGSLKMYVK